MTPGICVKFGLFSIAALLLAAFAWSVAQGQFRPPINRPPFNPQPINPQPINPRPINPPGMNPGGFPNSGPVIVKVWTCTKCGKELGRGMSAPPDRCPHCGVRIINGVGNGIREPGTGGGFAPPNPAPPIPNPPAFTPTDNSTTNFTPSSSSSSGLGKGKMIALIIAIIVVGVGVLLGGTWLMIYTMRSTESDRPRRRRRPRDDD